MEVKANNSVVKKLLSNAPCVLLCSLIVVFGTSPKSAQSQQLVNGGQTQMSSLDQEINDGTATDGKNQYKAFVFKFQGNLDVLIDNLSKSLGAPEIVHENPSARQLNFRRLKKDEWGGKRLVVGWMSMSNVDNHLVSITCSDNKHIDYLVPDSVQREKLKSLLHEAIAAASK